MQNHSLPFTARRLGLCAIARALPFGLLTLPLTAAPQAVSGESKVTAVLSQDETDQDKEV